MAQDVDRRRHPKENVRKIFATEAETLRAASADLHRTRRGDLKIDCDRRWHPELFADSQVDLRDLRSKIGGVAQVTFVRHSLSAGAALTTSFGCSKTVA
ncbi:hypothetical protein [Jannaschia donghaensis]|uniref:hypothetical protein n=1 Tax=Jannaschia donghaensis TaxID=420998 RepID=UPI001187708F|nr:hypothetical protein [Jannaschia donghaensis]